MSRILRRKSKGRLPNPQRNFFRRYFSLKQNKATFAGDKTLQIVCPSLKMAGIFLKGSIKFSPVFRVNKEPNALLSNNLFLNWLHPNGILSWNIYRNSKTKSEDDNIISIGRTYKIQNLEISFSKNKNYWITAFFGWENVSVSWNLGKYCLLEYIFVVLILTVLA